MLITSNYPTGWNAAHSELKVRYQRKDILINFIQSIVSGTKIGVVVPLLDSPTAFALIGKTIYINSDVYVGNYVMESSANFSLGTMLIINTPFISNVVGGYIVSNDYAPNYRIDTEFYKGDGTYITKMTSSTFADGVAEQELSEVLSKNIRQFQSTEIPSTEISHLSDNYEKFFIRYRERYTGYTGDYVVGATFTALNAVLQDGIVNDGTVNNYAPSLSETGVATKGKFLQSFEMPVMNINEDFELSFIWDGGVLQEYPLTLKVNYLNVNKGIISSYSQLLNENAVGGVCSFNLSELVLPQYCNYIDCWVEAGDTASRCLEFGTVEEGYVDNDAIAGGVIQTIIDNLIIKIETSQTNRMPLRWLNYLGGVSQWCFNRSYSLTNENKDNKAVITNDATKKSNITVTTNSHNRFITVGAEQLTVNQWEVLSEINIAQIKQNDTWVNVTVEHKNDAIMIDEALKREIIIGLTPTRTHK